ncbi:MAG: hypothetical protein MSA24_09245, partial [Selenomonadaceae bacterium]|nr:hypothetical protein [Selenomonadaceae bacterium]
GRGWSYETTAFALGVKSVFYQLWGCCGFAVATPGLVLFFQAAGFRCLSGVGYRTGIECRYSLCHGI